MDRPLALNNDVKGDGAEGDPTEVALCCLAREAGFVRAELEKDLPRIGELAFDARRKRMTTAHRCPEGRVVIFVKGAPSPSPPPCFGR